MTQFERFKRYNQRPKTNIRKTKMESSNKISTELQASALRHA